MLIRRKDSNVFIIMVVVTCSYFIFYGALMFTVLGFKGLLIGWNVILIAGVIATYVRNKKINFINHLTEISNGAE